MTNVEAVMKWFEDLLGHQPIPHASGKRVARAGDEEDVTYDREPTIEWVTQAESAIKRVFPPGDPLVARWDANFVQATKGSSYHLTDQRTVATAKAIFKAAHDMLKQGRLSSFIEGIRAETVGDLLDQAETLVAEGYQVAAAVIAGGALETCLLHLCQRNGLQWQGTGAIAAYEAALAQSRKAGKEVISGSYGQQVIAWGKDRNEAAHQPADFKKTKDEVRLMIGGIRQFVARYQ
jgi:hypothetical protein